MADQHQLLEEDEEEGMNDVVEVTGHRSVDAGSVGSSEHSQVLKEVREDCMLLGDEDRGSSEGRDENSGPSDGEIALPIEDGDRPVLDVVDSVFLLSGKSPKEAKSIRRRIRSKETGYSCLTICIVFCILMIMLLGAGILVAVLVSIKDKGSEIPLPSPLIENRTESATGWEAVLVMAQNPPHVHDVDIARVHVSVVYETDERLQIKFYDEDSSRWEVPGVVDPAVRSVQVHPSNAKLYRVEYEEDPFGFRVIREANDEVLFDTTPGDPLAFDGLIFEDHFLQVISRLPQTPNIYGLGERVESLRLPLDANYTMWNGDFGTPHHSNLYGTHPFYMDVREGGNAHGVFLLNSNAMDVTLSSGRLVWRTIGGVLDFSFFLGPTPKDVVSQYTELVGKPYFPPFWALGFHQCRWGYHTVQDIELVAQKYRDAEIPLDVMWNDIDYMEDYKDFTLDPVRYDRTQTQTFVNNLHTLHQRYVHIIDPGIKIEAGYRPYDDGLNDSVFIRDEKDKPLVGKVWPGETYFPDWTHPNTSAWWKLQIDRFRTEDVSVDGLWIDMNEIANFCDGECPDGLSTPPPNDFDPDHPPYRPGSRLLYDHTIFPSAKHYGGSEYDWHSLYGFMEQKLTAEVLESVTSLRSFTLTRSSFAGSGHYGFHWLGDNWSTFRDLYYSIPGVLAFNMFGVPMVGADICGFSGNTTRELCMRWVEVGAFYPFCRNHNGWDFVSQEFYAFDETFTNVSRFHLETRYRLFPYLYTLFGLASRDGATVARPLFFEFAGDEETYGIDRSFMLGPALMLWPVLELGVTNVHAYLPEATWYDFWNGTEVGTGKQWVDLDTPLERTNLLFRGGSIVPLQDARLTLEDTRATDITLLMALDAAGSAFGSVWFDDGDGLNTISGLVFTEVSFVASRSGLNTTVSATILTSGYATSVALSRFKVMGFPAVSEVLVNGVSHGSFSYDPSTKVLDISALSLSLMSPWTIVLTES